MLKLNNEQAAAAWEDYKEFHELEKRFLAVNIKHIEQAFKYAFALGMDTAERSAAQQPEPIKAVVKKPIKRTVTTRITRTYEQRKKEAQYLAQIMNGSGEWKLSEVVNSMRMSGFTDWNDNNATGFVKDAAKHYPQIKRIGYGLYKYEG